jgi:uncharacterized protein
MLTRMPRRLLIIPILFLTLMVGNPVLSADLMLGLDAFHRKDYATAFREFKPLAEQGVPIAQTSMGMLYQNGFGVSKNYKAAIKWYTLAAKQGEVAAQNSLGGMYKDGKGVKKDYKAAVKWYTLAAEQGAAPAQTYLAFMYVFGRGVRKDFVRAYMLAIMSAYGGFNNAAELRDALAKQMTPEQIKTGHRLARECVKKNYKGC